jgi:tRNA-binding EMAP/Myf-like protein
MLQKLWNAEKNFQAELLEIFPLNYGTNYFLSLFSFSFNKSEFRVGQVTEVSEHPQAENLYILRIDLGAEKTRTVVSGLKANYKDKNTLVGKTVIVLCNLKDAKFKVETREINETRTGFH